MLIIAPVDNIGNCNLILITNGIVVVNSELQFSTFFKFSFNMIAIELQFSTFFSLNFMCQLSNYSFLSFFLFDDFIKPVMSDCCIG